MPAIMAPAILSMAMYLRAGWRALQLSVTPLSKSDLRGKQKRPVAHKRRSKGRCTIGFFHPVKLKRAADWRSERVNNDRLVGRRPWQRLSAYVVAPWRLPLAPSSASVEVRLAVVFDVDGCKRYNRESLGIRTRHSE